MRLDEGSNEGKILFTVKLILNFDAQGLLRLRFFFSLIIKFEFSEFKYLQKKF